MAKVFDAKKFISDRTCELRLSNGITLQVAELPENALEVLKSMSTPSDGMTLQEERNQLAKFIGVEIDNFAGVGLIELRGVSDFLFENLLRSK